MADESSWTLSQHGAIAVLTFSRPPHNLLSFVVLDELDRVLTTLSRDHSVSVVVLNSAVPDYFVGHADLGDVGRLATGGDGPGSPDAWRTTLERLDAIDQPVIAAVNGQAWGGGCELTLAAQLRVAGPRAHFRFVEVGAGAIPGAGGTQRLPRLIGASRAARMVLSGDIVGPEQALAWGLIDALVGEEVLVDAVVDDEVLVDAVVPDGRFLQAVLDWAEPIASQPRHSLVAAKRALVDGLAMPLSAGLAYEQRLFRAVLQSEQTRAMHAEHR